MFYLIFVVEISFSINLVPFPIIVEETSGRNEEHGQLRFLPTKDLHRLESELIRELEAEDFQG